MFERKLKITMYRMARWAPVAILPLVLGATCSESGSGSNAVDIINTIGDVVVRILTAIAGNF